MFSSFLKDDEIAIVAYAETPVSRPKRTKETDEATPHLITPTQYYAIAINNALKKSGLAYHELEKYGLGVCGSEYPHSEILSGEIAQNLGFSPRWLCRSDHGGASALVLLTEAAMALHAGVIDFAIIAGSDSPVGSQQITTVQSAQTYVLDYEFPIGLKGPNNLFALVAKKHMEVYGTTESQLGKIAVMQRANALRNENAYLRTPITIEDYLKSEIVSEPLKRLDCCIRVNGGLAVILTRKELAARITDKPVFLRGFGGSFNYSFGDSMLTDVTYSGFTESSKIAFEIANTTASKCSLFELYDDYTIMALMELEDIGLCKKGEGGKFVERSEFTPEGDVPMNTGGGLLSAGQPGLAGGFVPLVESIRQLQNEAVGRQVKNPISALVTGGGGIAYGKNLGNCMTAVLA